MALAAIMAASGTSPVMAQAGFNPSKGRTQIMTETEDTQPGAETVQTETEDPFHAELTDDTKVITPYYSITTPDDWKGAYRIEAFTSFNGMWLKFFTIDENGYSPGHLFSVFLTEDEEYKTIANYEFLGDLEDADGRVHHVVAVFPTDVQYSRENAESYKAMSSEREAILDTLTAADGCEYHKTLER